MKHQSQENIREIKSRIKKVRKQNGLTQGAFGDKLNVSQSIVSLLESGRMQMPLDLLFKIADTFEVNGQWLVFGQEGENTRGERPAMPYISQESTGKYLRHLDDSAFLKKLPVYALPGFSAEREYLIIEVEHDRMMPHLMPNDKMVCRRVREPANAREGGIYVVVTQTEMMPGRLYFKNRESREEIRFEADHRRADTRHFQLSEIRQLWEVEEKMTSYFVEKSMEQDRRISRLEDALANLKNQVHGPQNPSDNLHVVDERKKDNGSDDKKDE